MDPYLLIKLSPLGKEEEEKGGMKEGRRKNSGVSGAKHKTWAPPFTPTVTSVFSSLTKVQKNVQEGFPMAPREA